MLKPNLRKTESVPGHVVFTQRVQRAEGAIFCSTKLLNDFLHDCRMKRGTVIDSRDGQLNPNLDNTTQVNHFPNLPFNDNHELLDYWI